MKSPRQREKLSFGESSVLHGRDVERDFRKMYDKMGLNGRIGMRGNSLVIFFYQEILNILNFTNNSLLSNMKSNG